MSEADTIKSYLISLGFKIDTEVYKKFMDSIKNLDDKMGKTTSLMSSSWVKSGAIVVGAMLTIIATTAKLLQSLAQADLGYEKFAMHMFMAKNQAKQFKIVTDAMGESIENMRWIPELQKKFTELKFDAMRMELPKQYEEEMKKIRGINTEFTRLKIESTYALQWIGFNIAKNLSGPMADIKEKFAGFNEYIIKHLPEIAKKISDILSPIIGIIVNVGKAILTVIGVVKKLWDSFSPEQRALVVLFFATMLIYLFPITAAIVSLTLVVSEFMDLFAGKKTLLPSAFLKGLMISTLLALTPLNALYVILRSVATEMAALAAIAVSLFKGLANPSTLKSELENIVDVQKQAVKIIAKGWIPDTLKSSWKILFPSEEDKKDSMFYWNDKERDEAIKNAIAGKGQVRDVDLDKSKTSSVQVPLGSQGTGLPADYVPRSGKPGKQTIPNEDIMREAQRASKELNIPANLIFAQWYGETGGFKQYSGAFNLGNIENKNRQAGEGRFQHYSSLTNYGDAYIDLMKRNYQKTRGVKTSEEFSSKLKQGRVGGYFEEPEDFYTKMLKLNEDKYGIAGGGAMNNSNNTNNVNVTIAIDGSRDPKEIGRAVVSSINNFMHHNQSVADYKKKPQSASIAGVRG